MEFLAAKIWILFWISVTLTMLGFAYYARNEAIQKVASALFLAFVVTHIFDGMVGKIPFYALADLVCLVYCLYLWHTVERSNPVPPMVATVFVAMLAVHAISRGPSFNYGLALSVLYALQLVILCRYSHQYGKVARQSQKPQDRDDPFHKVAVWLIPTRSH